MRIVTWNLAHRKTSSAAWTYLRQELKADFALLQEAIRPSLRDGEAFVFEEAFGSWGTAIYARGASLRRTPIEIPIADYPGRVVGAALTLPDGRELSLVSIHAPIVKGQVFPYLKQIFDAVESAVGSGSFVVGGDLNSARLAEKVWPGYGHGPFFEELARSVFFDCYHKFHADEQQTFFRSGSSTPIQDDHLFASHDLEPSLRSCEVVDNRPLGLSDHIPLLAEFDL